MRREARAGAAVRLWLLGLAPLALLAALLAAIVALRPADAIRGQAPPVERLTFQRVELTPHGIAATVLNDGPDPVTVAQVQVDEAYWDFAIRPARRLGHLGRARIEIPYPWVEGEVHELRLISATGVTFDHTIEVAVATPEPSWRFLGVFALIGVYVGVLPVALGLLWYPFVGRLGRRALDFVLALTVGLLLFLLVDAVGDGVEAAAGLAGSFQGLALFAFAALFAYLAIEGLGRSLERRHAAAGAAWVLALLVAVGIGLHNFGEGLAIGAAFALGEAALGTLLVVGFTLHNTTEGLAIVAPLAQQRTPLARLALLGLIAGLPTIGGAWLGGFVYSPVWSVVFLALGAGAIAQVIAQIARGTAGERSLAALARSAPVIGGLLAGFAVMYATGMLVG
jgi:zinc transporter ZupT